MSVKFAEYLRAIASKTQNDIAQKKHKEYVEAEISSIVDKCKNTANDGDFTYAHSDSVYLPELGKFFKENGFEFNYENDYWTLSWAKMWDNKFICITDKPLCNMLFQLSMKKIAQVSEHIKETCEDAAIDGLMTVFIPLENKYPYINFLHNEGFQFVYTTNYTSSEYTHSQQGYLISW